MRMICVQCKYDWDTLEESGGLREVCPECYSEDIYDVPDILNIVEEYFDEHDRLSRKKEELRTTDDQDLDEEKEW